MSKKCGFLFGGAICITCIVWWALSFFIQGDAHSSAIPKDVSALARIKLNTITDFLQADHPLKNEVMTRFVSLQTGISTSCPIYVFLSTDGTPGVVCAVANRSKLTSCLQDMKLDVHVVNRLSWISLENVEIVFDDDKLLAFLSQNIEDVSELRSKMQVLMQDKETTECELLHIVRSLDVPLAMTFRGDALPQAYERLLADFLPNRAQTRDLLFTFQCIREKSILKMDGSLSTTKPVLNAILDSMDRVFLPIDKTYSESSFAHNNMSWGNVHLNVEGKNLLTFARSIPKVRLALLGLNMCIDADMMLSSIKGPVNLRFGEANQLENDVLAVAQLHNTDFLQNASIWNDNLTGGSMHFARLSQTDFYINALEHDLWFGTVDKQLYISNHQYAPMSSTTTSLNVVTAGEKDKRMIATFLFDNYIPMFCKKIPDNDLRSVAQIFFSTKHLMRFYVTDSRNFQVQIE